MSVLSIRDLRKEIGKNIFIHPLITNNIKSNTINLTVSKFAWSVHTKKSICEGKIVKIPPYDTALIYTNEAIYVSRKIGGTYHSKVSMVSMGLGHIGTTLDPQYLGLSLIALHNNSGETVELKVGTTFVSLMFHYLKTPTYKKKSHDNNPGQPELLQNYKEIDEFNSWSEEHNWTKMQEELENEMLKSSQYKELERLNYEDKFIINLLHNYPLIGYLLKAISIGLAIVIFLYIVDEYSLENSSGYILFMIAIISFLVPKLFGYIDEL